MGEKIGVEAALDQAMGEAEALAPAAEQLDMLPLDAPRPGGDGVVARGPGRPPGARNKRTEEIADYILSRYRHPLEGLAQAYSVPTDELAKRLRCKPIEAFRAQIEAMKALAPYVAQKLPIAVNLNGQVVTLTLADLDSIGAMAAEGDGQVIEATVLDDESEGNQ